MQRLILSLRGCAIVLFLSILTSGAQLFIGDSIASSTTSKKQCGFVEYTPDIRLKLDCGEHVVVRERNVVLSYIKNPGLIECDVYRGVAGDLEVYSCAPRP